MHPAYRASLNIADLSFDLYRSVLDDIGDQALRWKPDGAGNTFQVLITHSIVATRFWLQVGCGIERSLSEYRAGEREAAFVDATRTKEALNADIDAYLAELASEAEAATGETLTRTTSFTDVPDPMQVTGWEAMLRGLAHLREHVGETQLMRDMWLARR
jgi:hypothetical protein